MEQFVLVRHGETAWNSDNRIQGSVDIPLSDKGRMQAESLACYMDENGFTFDLTFCSDLKRSRNTAEILCERLKLAPPVADPLLREINCGRWESRAIEDLKSHEGDLYFKWLDDAAFRVPEGERILDVRARVEEFFRQRAGVLQEARRVLVVGHGILNRMVLAVLMGLDSQAARYFSQENTALNIFEWIGPRKYCTLWNGKPHL